jgi:hypothetical protein
MFLSSKQTSETGSRGTGSPRRNRRSVHNISVFLRYLIIFSLISGRLLLKTVAVAETRELSKASLNKQQFLIKTEARM